MRAARLVVPIVVMYTKCLTLFREGEWVDIKNGASSLLRKELGRAKTKGPVSIFMSSSTDPYQPIEYKEKGSDE